MNQAALFHFAVQKNERLYQFIVQPGAPWEELDEALDQLKKEFHELRAQVEAEALKKDQDEAAKKVAESQSGAADLVQS
jgi:hypothetical protein